MCENGTSCNILIVVPRGGKYGFDTDIVPMTGIYNALPRHSLLRQSGTLCENRKVGWGRGEERCCLAIFPKY